MNKKWTDDIKSIESYDREYNIIELRFEGDPKLYEIGNVFLDENSNIEIKDTKDGLRLIITAANESKPPVIYELKTR